MKLAALGVITVVAGLAAGVDGLAIAGAVWIAGGLLLKAVLTGVDLEARDPANPRWSDLLGGRRGFASVITGATGAASIAIGLVPVGFEGDDPLRWIPVAIGIVIAGMPVIAIAMFTLGSGLGAVADAIGTPDHPATITVHSFTETGMRINDRPRIEFELTVHPADGDPYDLTTKMVVGHTELGSMQRGRTYRGLVDLGKPSAVDIDWHDPIDETGTAGTVDDVTLRLARVDDLLRDGTITADEHATARRDILDDL